MDAILPYIATGITAMGMLVLLMSAGGTGRLLGGLTALAGLAWISVQATALPGGPGDVAQFMFFLVFALIAVASACKMIVQQRPVYSALFFVLVVLSVCGLLVLLEAFFMAFAVVIVYAGAILITYMFVLMLAQQAADADHESEIPVYDRQPREPVSAVIIGGLFLCIIVGAVFTGLDDLGAEPTDRVRLEADAKLYDQLPRLLEREVLAVQSDFAWPSAREDVPSVHVEGDALVVHGHTDSGEAVTVPLRDGPGNTSHVGWVLVAAFPASLEVAGVILLMAMFGAVVLARRQVEHAEAAMARSAGVERPDFTDDDSEAGA